MTEYQFLDIKDTITIHTLHVFSTVQHTVHEYTDNIKQDYVYAYINIICCDRSLSKSETYTQ